MPRGRKKALAAAVAETSTPESSYITVKLDLLSGKVSVESDEPVALNISKDVANLMMYYYKGNHGQASYKLVIEGITAGNVIDESKDKMAIYKAPYSYWETLISITDLLLMINTAISVQLNKKTTWWKEKKTVSIVRKVKAS